MTLEITSRKIMCNGCASNVTRVLSAQKGVRLVKVDVPIKKVSIEFDESVTNEAEIRKTMEQASYPAD